MAYRDDELSAQEHVVWLQKELAERDILIEKLTAPKKRDNDSRGRVACTAKKALRAMRRYCLPAAVILGFLFFTAILIEPNEELIADGVILNVWTDLMAIDTNNCQLIKNTAGAFVSANCSAKDYGVKVKFADKRGARKIFDLEPGERLGGRGNEWNFSYHRLTGRSDMLYLGEGKDRAVPHSGCKVKVHYKIGKWFGDHSWVDNFVDASMCGKPAENAVGKR